MGSSPETDWPCADCLSVFLCLEIFAPSTTPEETIRFQAVGEGFAPCDIQYFARSPSTFDWCFRGSCHPTISIYFPLFGLERLGTTTSRKKGLLRRPKRIRRIVSIGNIVA